MSSKIIYDEKIMKFMSIFESITHAQLKDCVNQEGIVIFIVQQNEIGKAIGAKGSNVHKLERVFNKKVKIVEFSPEPVSFIKNLIYPLQVKEIREDDGTYVITAVDLKTRGMLIGRNASHLRAYEAVVQRYFPIKELKVV
ncbi:MAG: NusA-like transcription termination signal-binding factor [Candidatus Woesearchaeota archaeon]